MYMYYVPTYRNSYHICIPAVLKLLHVTTHAICAKYVSVNLDRLLDQIQIKAASSLCLYIVTAKWEKCIS